MNQLNHQAGIATTITQPLDVMKTRIMNAKQGQYNGIVDCALQTARTGPLSFFKVRALCLEMDFGA